MVKSNDSLTDGVIWKRMIIFALPILLGNLFQQLYNTVDTLIVGNYLGSSALAAVSSSGSLIFMLIGFLTGIASGAGVIISRFYGAKDIKNLQIAIHTTVAFGLIAGIIMTFVGVYFSPNILRLMGTPVGVIRESIIYLQIYFSGSLGFVMYNVFVGIFQAVGDSKHPLYYLIISSIVNLVLDIVFIKFFHMGVGGAGLATVISQGISSILCLIQLLKSKMEYRLRINKIKINNNILSLIIKIGLPSGIQNSIIAFANVLVQSSVNSFGELAMAGYGAYSKVEGFGFLPINSFSMAITTFVGQNLGSKQYERAKTGVKFGVWMAVILAEIIGVIVFIFAPQMIKAFDPSPEVIKFGVEKARTAALFYCVLAYSNSIAAVLRGAGKAIVSMFVMILFWCIIRVAFLAITIPLTNNIIMVYAVYPITWSLSSIFLFIYYRKSNWMFNHKKLN